MVLGVDLVVLDLVGLILFGVVTVVVAWIVWDFIVLFRSYFRFINDEYAFLLLFKSCARVLA